MKVLPTMSDSFILSPQQSLKQDRTQENQTATASLMQHVLSNHLKKNHLCLLDELTTRDLPIEQLTAARFPMAPRDRQVIRTAHIERSVFTKLATDLFYAPEPIQKASFWARLMPLWRVAQKEVAYTTEKEKQPIACLTLIPPSGVVKYWKPCSGIQDRLKNAAALVVAFSVHDHETQNYLHLRVFHGIDQQQSTMMVFTSAEPDPFAIVHRRNLVQSGEAAHDRLCAFIASGPLPLLSNDK